MGLLYGRAGRLNTKNAGFRPGQGLTRGGLAAEYQKRRREKEAAYSHPYEGVHWPLEMLEKIGRGEDIDKGEYEKVASGGSKPALWVAEPAEVRSKLPAPACRHPRQRRHARGWPPP
jgi:hypothetical protein